MVLSEDESSEDGADDDEFVDIRPCTKRQRGESKRAKAHRDGGKRIPVYEKPVPLQWKDVPGGWQEYTLPDPTRVYARRFFEYSDSFKVGQVVLVRPEPPDFFSDKYIFMASTSKLPGTLTTSGHVDEMRRRMEVRVVRHSYNYFCHKDFASMRDQGPDAVVTFDAALGVANENLIKVFGESIVEGESVVGVEAWSTKNLWAWAVPEIELTGHNLLAFQTGSLSTIQSTTQRLLALYTLGRPAVFKDLTGTANRLETIDGDLRTAADLLRDVLQNGVLVRVNASKWKQRLNLALLFDDYDVKHGKASPSGEHYKGADYAVGDPLKLTLFELTGGKLSKMVKAPAGPDVKLDQHGIFCLNLTESSVNMAIKELEKTCSFKKPMHPAASMAGRSRGSGSGKMRFYEVGKVAVHRLEELLPQLDVPVLQMLSRDCTARQDLDEDKQALIESIINYVVPNYSLSRPQELEAEPVDELEADQHDAA